MLSLPNSFKFEQQRLDEYVPKFVKFAISSVMKNQLVGSHSIMINLTWLVGLLEKKNRLDLDKIEGCATS